jgi:anion-transporting  ArsA/GET3 family ATPase
MESLLRRNLLVITGKGGVGKTTIAAAVGLLAARGGRPAVLVDAAGDGDHLRRLLSPLLGAPAAPAQAPLAVHSIDPEAALAEWMQRLGGRLPSTLLTSRASFQYFAAAAPGARELVTTIEVARLVAQDPQRLVVLDAPATGHALALLHSPQTFATIARVGPIAGEAESVRRLLLDPARTGYLAVAAATEMAVTETLELAADLQEQLGVALHAVIVNATLRRRFSGAELDLVSALAANGLDAEARPLVHAAIAATRTAHSRGRRQHNQIARLRRHRLAVLQVPFVFAPDLDLDALHQIAARLDGRL